MYDKKIQVASGKFYGIPRDSVANYNWYLSVDFHSV